jgi:hypothetical protein
MILVETLRLAEEADEECRMAKQRKAEERKAVLWMEEKRTVLL